MKINSRTKLRQNIKKIIVFSILLAAVFVVLNLTGFSKHVKNFFFLISSPVQKTFWQTGKGVSDFFSGILEPATCKIELSGLYLERQDLLGRIAALAELEKENETLREALNLELEKEFRMTLVRLTSKDVFHDSILIDKGKRDGISGGWPVITAQKVLVGKIGEVYDNFSEVILISDKESSFDAKIIESEIYGIIKGTGNFRFYLDLIPKDEEISKGEAVVTSSLTGVYPQGLLVGEIKTIDKSDAASFQKAEITPFFNIKNLDYLFVITEF
jgi:rod shape-determining protein MreC